MVARTRNRDLVTLGLIQMSTSESPDANLAKRCYESALPPRRALRSSVSRNCFARATFARAKIIATSNWPKPFPARAPKRSGKFAQDNKIVIVASLFEKRSAGIYHNTAVVIDADGSIAGKYRKMHIPDDPLYYEKFYFTPGDLGFPSFQTRYAKIAALVCWDQWFPEGGSPDVSRRSADSFLSDRHRLDSQGAARRRTKSTQCLGNYPTLPRGGQRRLCRCGQSSWPRGKTQILGSFFCRRSVRRNHRARERRARRDRHCQVRSPSRSKRHVRVGRSSAIGVSMPMAICNHASLSQFEKH